MTTTTSTETRTYRGSTLEELLPTIRAELGENAVIIRQREGLVGGIGEFEGIWTMAYVRGPDGIIVALAERIG